MFINPIKWQSTCSEDNYELKKLTSKIGYTSKLEPTDIESCKKLDNAVRKYLSKKLGLSSDDHVVLYLREFLGMIDDKNIYNATSNPESLCDKVYDRKTTIKNNINSMLD